MRNRWLMVLVTLLAAFGLVFTGCGGGSSIPTYQVTFDQNTEEDVTGMPSPNPATVSEGGKVTKPSPAPTYEEGEQSYYVDYWSTDEDGEEEWNFNDGVYEDMTLYAHWEAGEEPEDTTTKELMDSLFDDLEGVALGDYTVWGDAGKGQSHSGWASNGYDRLTTELDIATLLSAEYLVLELTGKPRGGIQLVWQGAGGEGVLESDWNSSDIMQTNGDPNSAKGTAWDAENGLLIIELSKAFATTTKLGYDKFLTCTEGAKILLGYWSGTPSGLPGLGLISAWLLVPTVPPEMVTVSFDTDGGEPEEIESIEVIKGFPMGGQYPDNPSKEDFIFGGWYDEDDVLYTASTPNITADVELTAKWVTPFTVTFNTDGGTPATIAERKIGDGLPVGTLPTPTKTGYAFDGWFDGEDHQYTAVSLITADVALTAKWTKLHTVTFKADASDTTALKTVTGIRDGTSLIAANFPDDNPTKDGHIFGGWYASTDTLFATRYDSDAPAPIPVIAITADITLVAKWTALQNARTITFKISASDTEPYATRQVESGDSIGIANFPRKPSKGYSVFTGWKNGGDFTASTPVTTNITVIAQWNDPLVITDFTVSDAWWRWKDGKGSTDGICDNNVAPFDGDGMAEIDLSDVDFTGYDAMLIYLEVDDKSDQGIPALMIKSGSINDNVAIKDGDCAIAIAGSNFEIVAEEGKVGFQPYIYGNPVNNGTYDVKFISIMLLPEIPPETYGEQADGSYVFNPRNLENWYGATLFLDTIQFTSGGYKLPYPVDFVFDDYETLVIEYEASGFGSQTARVGIAQYAGDDVWDWTMEASGTLEMKLSERNCAWGEKYLDATGLAIKTLTTSVPFDFRIVSITFYPPVEE